MNQDERIIANNRKAKFEYSILDSYEAGIILTGSEVKSIRLGNVNLQEGYAFTKQNGVFLSGVNISPYKEANILNHDPVRERKLLLNKSEIRKLSAKTKEKGLTLIPLKMYFKNGFIKIELGLCAGKKLHDKRERIKERETERKINYIKKQKY